MSTSPIARHRKYGLYYPYFHVRDDRWLKAAALYWPRIVRIVPEDYATRDSETVRVLSSELGFIESIPPGKSVDAVAPRFLELLADHTDLLRSRLGVGPEDVRSFLAHGTAMGRPGRETSRVGALHSSQVSPDLLDALVDAGLAHPGRLSLSYEVDRSWVVMDESLVSLYTSVLSEHFASTNQLQLTTDQPDAYAITNQWSATHMAAALLKIRAPVATTAEPELVQRLAFLALALVVPAELDRLPVRKVVELRERHGKEFLEFGQAVDQAADELAHLAGMNDEQMLQRYLEDEVNSRFRLPLEELRGRLQEMRLGTAVMAVNVKTELPTTLALAGGAWLAEHSLVAGTTAAALGLLSIRRDARQQKEEALQTAGPASFLFHTEGALEEKHLLEHTLRRLRRVAGA